MRAESFSYCIIDIEHISPRKYSSPYHYCTKCQTDKVSNINLFKSHALLDQHQVHQWILAVYFWSLVSWATWPPAWWSSRTSTWGRPPTSTSSTWPLSTLAPWSLPCQQNFTLCGVSIRGLLERCFQIDLYILFDKSTLDKFYPKH